MHKNNLVVMAMALAVSMTACDGGDSGDEGSSDPTPMATSGSTSGSSGAQGGTTAVASDTDPSATDPSDTDAPIPPATDTDSTDTDSEPPPTSASDSDSDSDTDDSSDSNECNTGGCCDDNRMFCSPEETACKDYVDRLYACELQDPKIDYDGECLAAYFDAREISNECGWATRDYYGCYGSAAWTCEQLASGEELCVDAAAEVVEECGKSGATD